MGAEVEEEFSPTASNTSESVGVEEEEEEESAEVEKALLLDENKVFIEWLEMGPS